MVACIAAGIVFCAVGAVGTQWHQVSVERQWVQPKTVSYSDGATHYATVVRRTSLAAVAGLADPEILVVLGRDPSGNYGHPVRLETGFGQGIPSDVRWATDGVTIGYSSGHRVFVPAASFQGGR